MMTRIFPLFIGMVLSAAISSAPAATHDYPVPYSKPKVDDITRILRAVRSQIEASSFTTLARRPFLR